MRDMKDSGVEWIGEIPIQWDSCKMLYLLRGKITDGPHETPELVTEGIPFISVDIVEHLNKKCDQIDKLIAIKQQKIDKLNEYKKSIIYEYVTGKKEVS